MERKKKERKEKNTLHYDCLQKDTIVGGQEPGRVLGGVPVTGHFQIQSLRQRF